MGEQENYEGLSISHALAALALNSDLIGNVWFMDVPEDKENETMNLSQAYKFPNSGASE